MYTAVKTKYNIWLSSLQPSEVPSPYFEWLTQPYILSEAIKRVSENQFSVNVLQQKISDLEEDESDLLGCSTGFLREVFLNGRQMPWIYARVVVPTPALRPNLHPLITLGDRPLGTTLLYNDPSVTRSGFQYRFYPRFHMGYAATHLKFGEKPLWARRSLFHMEDQNIYLLVSEFFSPDIPVYW